MPIIEPQITTSTIFVEPFCGSSIVSFNVFKNINKNIDFHINDLDPLRIKFYKNMNKKKKDKNYINWKKKQQKKEQNFVFLLLEEKMMII